MREILFRGKRKDNGEWIEGSLVNRYDGGFSIIFHDEEFFRRTEGGGSRVI